MTEGKRWSICALAHWGMTGRTIAQKKLGCKCRVANGTCSHIAEVYRCTRADGIRMYDYREGKTTESKTVFRSCKTVFRSCNRRPK